MAEWLASQSVSARTAFSRDLTVEQKAAAYYDWHFWARPGQLAPPHDWAIWIQLAGRGYGKTRSGAEWVRERVEQGQAKRIALVAPTPADARDVMVEGESGLLAVFPPWNAPHFEPSKRRITFHTGATATIYSGFEPDQLRGPQHDTAWCDELASWQYPRETWDNLQFGMRLGDPRICITTTPKPISLLRELLKDPKVAKTHGSTYENQANLPASFFRDIVSKYEGTSLGQQELHAALLDEMPGALLKREILERYRLDRAPDLVRVVVAVDPAVTVTEESSETGILVCGIDNQKPCHGYVLADLSGRLSSESWARRAVHAYHQRQADRIVGEQNNGGDLVRDTILTVDPNVSYKAVHASKGKYTRAEPVASLYEQGRIHHIGAFPQLEDQWCTWLLGEDSPDRLDACVWALSELMLHAQPTAVAPGIVDGRSKWAEGQSGSLMQSGGRERWIGQ